MNPSLTRRLPDGYFLLKPRTEKNFLFLRGSIQLIDHRDRYAELGGERYVPERFRRDEPGQRTTQPREVLA